MKYFREEYLAHIEERLCPAGVCRSLTTFIIEAEKCKACGMCLKACPTDAITGGKKKIPADINQEKCIQCGGCRDVCKFDAVATDLTVPTPSPIQASGEKD